MVLSDSLKSDNSVRTFNVIDDSNRECITIEVGSSLPTKREFCSLQRPIEERGKSSALRCDNGPKCISQDLIKWAKQELITPLYIHSGKPTQDAYVE